MKTSPLATDVKSQIAELLQSDLDAVNAVMRGHMRSSSEFVSDVLGHVDRFRGKQIRPVLLLLVHRSLGGEATREAKMLAAAMEMIHTATLVHDDVIDEAETRRHVATVHRRWNAETSVLLGDYLFSKAFHLTAATGDAEACRLIGVATDRTCEGELNQSAARMNRELSDIDYFRIIRDKTGQLFAVSCQLGARSAGATKAQQAAARRFGMRLGLAFQIADDVLDVSGDESLTGKDEQNDIENGRMTLPLLRAVRHAAADERSEILEMISGSSAGDLAKHPAVKRGIESAESTAQELVKRAVADLQRLPDCAERSLMAAIAQFSVARSH